jgi:hypothetical protein
MYSAVLTDGFAATLCEPVTVDAADFDSMACPQHTVSVAIPTPIVRHARDLCSIVRMLLSPRLLVLGRSPPATAVPVPFASSGGRSTAR